MEGKEEHAPGWPVIPARWTSSAKSGVGTALNAASRVWFTLSHGIFNEIYFPRVDQDCTRATPSQCSLPIRASASITRATRNSSFPFLRKPRERNVISEHRIQRMGAEEQPSQWRERA